MKDHQDRIHEALPLKRNIIHVIDRFRLAGICVDIVAKTHTLSLKKVYYTLLRIMFSPVKGHVLKEMRQTILIWSFLKSTHIMHYIEVCITFRISVMPDVIGHPVIQRPFDNKTIHRHRLSNSGYRRKQGYGNR